MPIADKYQLFYEISALLNKDATIIPAPIIEKADVYEDFAEAMDRLAQPLADGSPSPFSSRSELSAEGILMNVFLYYLQLLKHQVNLTPTAFLINWYRTIGVARAEATYSVIEMRFTRSAEAIRNSIFPFIPLGTMILSRSSSDYVITTEEVQFGAGADTILVPARHSQIGKFPIGTRIGDFSVISRNLPYIESATNTGIILSNGNNIDTVTTLLENARGLIQMPGNKASVPRDFVRIAKQVGATKATVLPNLRSLNFGSEYRPEKGLVTVVVYPESAQSAVTQIVSDQVEMGYRWDVKPARIVPLNGVISIKIDPILTSSEARDLAAIAISEQVNPPHGYWMDVNFPTTLSLKLQEVVRQFIPTPSKFRLKHAVSNAPFEELDILPGDLFEIQNDIEFEWEKYGANSF